MLSASLNKTLLPSFFPIRTIRTAGTRNSSVCPPAYPSHHERTLLPQNYISLLQLHGLLFPISSKGSFLYTYQALYYTSRGALAGTRNSSMGAPWRIDPTTHRTMSERSHHGHCSYGIQHLLFTNYSLRHYLVRMHVECSPYRDQ